MSCDRILQYAYSKDLARVLCDLVETNCYGIWHACNQGAATPAEFAETVVRKSGYFCRIIPVPEAKLPLPARRPLNGLLSAELPDGIAPMPSLENALDRYLEEIIH